MTRKQTAPSPVPVPPRGPRDPSQYATAFIRSNRAIYLGTEGEAAVVGMVEPEDRELIDRLAWHHQRPIRAKPLSHAELAAHLSRLVGERYGDEEAHRVRPTAGSDGAVYAGARGAAARGEEVRGAGARGEGVRGVGARGPSGGAVPGGNIGGRDVPGGGAAIDVLTRSSPAVSFVDALLHDAVGAGASDVHVETGAQRSVVRYRIDGVLHTVRSYRAGDFAMVVSRLKVLSRVDATERRLPQDGRFSFKVAGMAYDVRTSFLPCDGGESVAVRLLETADRSRDLGSLGLGAPEEGQLAGLDTAAGGLVVVSGPTGSGKTTTVHALLARYRDGRRKILTVEDPVEYRLSGVTQITVRRDIGLDFDAILRRVLRHDPDVLAVGEIRDGETAALAVRAALSGHPVFSTVHTPDTTSVQARFENLGVPPHLLREVTAAQISQRLVRRVCPVCGRWREASEGERRAAGAYGVVLGHVREGTGCPACRHAGYRGRVGVFRVHTAGFEGDPLPAAGWRLVLGGDTTPHELARSLGAAAWRMRSGGAR